MGTPWSITVYATDTLSARAAVDRAYERIDQVEDRLSDYRYDSEINRLFRSPPGAWYPVSGDLHTVLAYSVRLAERSGGAFDPTVGPLSRLWRKAFRSQEFPPWERIRAAAARVHYQSLEIGPDHEVRWAGDSIQLDLGGVAKGYGLDAAAEVLRAAGIHSYLIDGGGDLLLGEPPPERSAWRVATPLGVLDTSGVAIATSGATFRYLEWNGTRYSHLIDPRTGLGLTDPRTITVIAPTGMTADGLASAASVLGEAAYAQRFDGLPDIRVHWAVPPDQ